MYSDIVHSQYCLLSSCEIDFNYEFSTFLSTDFEQYYAPIISIYSVRFAWVQLHKLYRMVANSGSAALINALIGDGIIIRGKLL